MSSIRPRKITWPDVRSRVSRCMASRFVATFAGAFLGEEPDIGCRLVGRVPPLDHATAAVQLMQPILMCPLPVCRPSSRLADWPTRVTRPEDRCDVR